MSLLGGAIAICGVIVVNLWGKNQNIESWAVAEPER
jgi:hypothetical protein